jgi:hypothetical protein
MIVGDDFRFKLINLWPVRLGLHLKGAYDSLNQMQGSLHLATMPSKTRNWPQVYKLVPYGLLKFNIRGTKIRK